MVTCMRTQSVEAKTNRKFFSKFELLAGGAGKGTRLEMRAYVVKPQGVWVLTAAWLKDIHILLSQ